MRGGDTVSVSVAAELLSNDVIVKVGIGPTRNPFSNIITGN